MVEIIGTVDNRSDILVVHFACGHSRAYPREELEEMIVRPQRGLRWPCHDCAIEQRHATRDDS